MSFSNCANVCVLQLALAVAASAEPQYWGGYGTPLVHQAYAATPLKYQSYAAMPLQYQSYAATPYVHQKPVVYSAPIHNMPYKQPIYNMAYKQPIQHMGYKVKTYSNDAEKMTNYAAKGQYHAETEGSLHIAKREAEASVGIHNIFGQHIQPAVYSTPSVYTPAVYSHQTYSPYFAQPIHNMAYKQPIYNMAYKQPIQHMGYKVKTYSNDAEKMTNYAAKGQYRAETEGSLHIAKREAEASVGIHNIFGQHIQPAVYSTPSVYTPAVYSHQTYSPYFAQPIHNMAYKQPIYNMAYKQPIYSSSYLY
jgi:hypothetical protein